MIDSKEEFNDLLNRLKSKDKENKLGKSLQIKLQAFLEVEELINLRIGGVSKSLVADIRNKLTPINNLVAMLEDTNVTLLIDKEKAVFINTEIAKVKYTIEYLSNL